MNRAHPTTVVVGAGPYGLSVAAHLRAHRLPVLLFGRPMELWRRMPAGMCLKSSWSASSLSDPARAYSLDRYLAATGQARPDPIPLGLFCDYARWFQERAVPPVDETRVTCLRRTSGGFRLELADDRTVEAGRVVIAVGISRFVRLPGFARGLPPELASHTSECCDPGRYREREVAVVGAGQSALEWAALLHEAGARVQLITRRPVAWVDRRLYRLHPLVRDLLYAPSDVGPAGVSRVVDRQLLLRRLPARLRRSLTVRSVRPAGAAWLRPRVEGVIDVTQGVEVRSAEPVGRRLRLVLDDGDVREVDHLVLGTGFGPDLDRLEFLAPDLRTRIASEGPLPRLNRWFESSVPGLHFVGALAERDFGPLCRFVAGADTAARQVAQRALGR
ncbi:MAG TPA: FAD-dependent oxidoreductase [Candidatus Dormibacteraeota bacterium]|jgi:cation diffusion facilitator CzcD-associated flavoprotein CzcO|nr:FAD-dependent oxidoreductase [Candidatus Dormibacteraeota bacterium]